MYENKWTKYNQCTSGVMGGGGGGGGGGGVKQNQVVNRTEWLII